MPSVSGFDELSSQYMVRGGNFDENQVYVNDIEVYRPFLIRSGQQEGLSFINPDLVENIFFYPGGFGADKGDKLSSVLDVTYKKPQQNSTSTTLSLLGGSLANAYKKGKFSSLTGIRYRDNSLLVKSKDVNVDYHPKFMDAQTLLNYNVSKQLTIEFLGNVSLNLYNYKPLVKITKFGSYQDAKVVVIDYNGQEKDHYKTYFGAFKSTYKPNEQSQWMAIASLYNTQEEEYFDILGQYNVGEPNTDLGSDDFGNPENLESLGSELNHARNDLDALIGNFELKYKHKYPKKHQIEAGYKFSYEDIKDRINEWQVIDSAGFSLYPPGTFNIEEPYDLDTAPILPYQKTKAYNHAGIQRHIAYALWRQNFKLGPHSFWMNIGVRSQFYQVHDKLNNTTADGFIISPRLMLGLKPDWQKNMEFRLTTGLYQQAPFYKEFRRQNGSLNIHVKPQKSYIISLANDWYFDMWERPFKLTSEVYYKYLWDVNPYTLENVRIRYFATNNATAFAYGFESRLNGEFITGVESWFSLALMKTMENIDRRGYIYRPTDQRFKFAMLFQDYVPKIPNLKMYLNLTFNGGIPTGSPSYADPYDFQFRTDNYFRSDMGIFYVLSERPHKAKWLQKFKYFSAGFEILNMFDVQNSISNMWIRDIYSKKVYRVKNYLTGRIFNVKLRMKL
ncbi:MAG TPA: TonB-dependent receptor [Flavobacteriales bacterium]|nr:TonB-dependent receptor [Flavobacteriales bacterium]